MKSCCPIALCVAPGAVGSEVRKLQEWGGLCVNVEMYTCNVMESQEKGLLQCRGWALGAGDAPAAGPHQSTSCTEVSGML